MKNEYMDVPATRGDLGFRATFTGKAVGDFLLGYVSDSLLTRRGWSTSVTGRPRSSSRTTGRSAPKLSREPGPALRLHHPLARGQNRQANFDPTTGTLVQATDGSLEERGLVDPDKNNFAPRVGIVYKLNDSTVLRGGYGIFYNLFDRIGSEDQIALNPGTGLVSLQPPTASVASGPLFLLRNGFPAGYLDPARSTSRARSIRGADRDSPKASVHQFGVGAQKTFAQVWVVSLDLVGTEGRNLANLINLNQPLPNAAGNNALGPRPFPPSAADPVARGQGRVELQGHGPAVRAALLQGLRLQPGLHALRVRGQHGRAPRDRRLAQPLAGRARPRGVARARAATTRGTASSATSSWSCRSRRTARARRRRCSATGCSPASTRRAPAGRSRSPRAATTSARTTPACPTRPAAATAADGGPLVQPRRFPGRAFGHVRQRQAQRPARTKLAGARPVAAEALRRRPHGLTLRWDVFNVFNTVNLGLPNAASRAPRSARSAAWPATRG